MKKSLIVLLLFIILLSMAACGGGDSPGDKQAAASNTELGSTPDSMQGIFDRIKEAVPIIGEAIVYDEDSNDLIGRPGGYVAVWGFADPRVKQVWSEHIGGDIYEFADEEQARSKYDSWTELASVGGVFSEYNYINGVFVMSIDSEIKPSEAKKYEAAFMGEEIPQDEQGEFVQLKVPISFIESKEETLREAKAGTVPENFALLGVTKNYIDGDNYIIELPLNKRDSFINYQYNALIDLIRSVPGKEGAEDVLGINASWEDDDPEGAVFIQVRKGRYEQDFLEGLGAGLAQQRYYYLHLIGKENSSFTIYFEDEHENSIFSMKCSKLDHQVSRW